MLIVWLVGWLSGNGFRTGEECGDRGSEGKEVGCAAAESSGGRSDLESSLKRIQIHIMNTSMNTNTFTYKISGIARDSPCII